MEPLEEAGRPRRLRVALTIEQCWHDVPGGTAVAALGMARGVLSTGEADVAGVSARHRRPPPEPWVPPFAVRSMPLPRPALYESWHRLRAPKVERATGRVDLIHATSFPMPPRSAPVVLTIHDLAWLADPSHFTRRGVSFFRRGLDLALRDADLVTCPSETTRADCVRQGFAPERVRVVPLGVDAARPAPQRVEEVTRRYGLTRPYVLWTGTIEPRKNLGGLVEAYRLLDADLDLVLAGPRGWNEDLDARLGAARERVHVLGFVPAADLPPLYAGASVFCFPSFMEGFGFPVLEAMAQGTPVVTSAGTSTEELAEGAGILVDPRDPQSIAAGMAEACERRDELSAAGRERAQGYTWERTGRLLVEAYREVA
ncbi:MAG TPA: glycosyltransferase family 1 protein [Actinomycetota bacterium]|nr:glycosyltransferase family 1 protein [Actinomycetota bacterium]